MPIIFSFCEKKTTTVGVLSSVNEENRGLFIGSSNFGQDVYNLLRNNNLNESIVCKKNIILKEKTKMKSNWAKCLLKMNVNMGIGANVLMLAGATAIIVDTMMKIVDREDLKKKEENKKKNRVRYSNNCKEGNKDVIDDLTEELASQRSLLVVLSDILAAQKQMNEKLDKRMTKEEEK